ncbi:hypothetical protein WJX81_000558 [Elliptochloris bilobata]|uniref:Rab-GAP TBC domain-containing protein n=1 Tax=Elliptochloris bilobata TaxID=381761 RepID=A0AAW1RJS4_9CHLO
MGLLLKSLLASVLVFLWPVALPTATLFWLGFFCWDIDVVIDRCFMFGCDADVRGELWLLLLGVFARDSNKKERDVVRANAARSFGRCQREIQRKSLLDIFPTWLRRPDPRWQAAKEQVDLDVSRTTCGDATIDEADLTGLLLAYVHEHDCAYTQGMSDLAAQLLVVFGNHFDAYAAFKALMARLNEADLPLFSPGEVNLAPNLEALGRLLTVLDPELSHAMAAAHERDGMGSREEI